MDLLVSLGQRMDFGISAGNLIEESIISLELIV